MIVNARTGRVARASLRLVGPLILGVFLWNTDLSAFAGVVRGAAGWLLAGAAALNLAIILIKAWRWRLLLRMQGAEFSFSRLWRLTAIGAAVAAWTPGRAGDFVRAVAVHRGGGVGLGRAVSSVLADRLMDAALMAMVAIAGVLLIAGAGSGQVVVLLAAMIGGMAIAARILVRGRSSTGKRARAIAGLLGAARRQIGEVLDGLAVLWTPALIVPLIVTGGATLVTFLQGYLLARSLSIDVGFWILAASLAAASIASLLPLSIAGIGTREAVLALFLVRGETQMPQVLAFSVAMLAIANGATALIGAIAWCLPGEPMAGQPGKIPAVDGDPGMP